MTRALALPTALLLAVGLAACGSGSSTSSDSSTSSSSRSGSGLDSTSDDVFSQRTAAREATEEADTDTVPAQDLQVGDCFTDMSTETKDDGETVTDVEVLDCSAPHLYEVYENADVEADAFPTDDAMDEQMSGLCYDPFEAYVGTSLDSSSLNATALTPTEQSWALGDRTITCVITSTDGSELTGSAKGSNA